MTSYVNLMTREARVRRCYCDCIRLWSRLLAVAVVLLSVHFLVNWWPVHTRNLDLQALEAHYQPLHKQKLGIGRLSRQISNLQSQAQLELAIARDTPPLSLLGILADTLADCQGKAFFERINYSQSGSYESRSHESERLTLEGLATDPWAVETLAEGLRTALPFAKVEIKTSEAIEINRHPMQSFHIDCVL